MHQKDRHKLYAGSFQRNLSRLRKRYQVSNFQTFPKERQLFFGYLRVLERWDIVRSLELTMQFPSSEFILDWISLDAPHTVLYWKLDIHIIFWLLNQANYDKYACPSSTWSYKKHVEKGEPSSFIHNRCRTKEGEHWITKSTNSKKAPSYLVDCQDRPNPFTQLVKKLLESNTVHNQ